MSRRPPDQQMTLLEVNVMADVVPLHQPRWEPDEHLIEAAIAGRVRLGDLPRPERAWLVAQLTHAGHTTDTIADWLHCSRRTVQNTRCEAVAVLTMRLLASQRATDQAEHRARTAQVTPAAVVDLAREVERLKTSRATLIDQLAEMRRRCDTPCPPQVLIIHPPRRRAPRRPEVTMPLFEMGA